MAPKASEEEKQRFIFKIYDINNDGFISNGELFQIFKLMARDSITDLQLQQLVDRTIVKADKDKDGKISFPEFRELLRGIKMIDDLEIIAPEASDNAAHWPEWNNENPFASLTSYLKT